MAFVTVLESIRAAFPPHDDLWYVLTAAAVSSLNHPEDVAHVYHFVEKEIDGMNVSAKEKEEAKIKAVMRLRDGILKSYIAHGFPKTINGLKQLYNATPETIREKLPSSPIRRESTWNDIEEQRKRGRGLWDKIYDRHTERVANDMYKYYPDLGQVAFHHLYGPVLSETAILSGKESSMVLVTGLKAEDLGTQLRGHAYGALHQGATKEDLARIDNLVVRLCNYYHIEQPKAKL
ncbi:hypothetical protein O0I10_006109 [Lichtheimia ornata]|uniref:Carboxymuconolactone decarboxylase-like domain-containing protein n=1 Tax=Lichtheimia ornata TaxID=688661 RepID=A0AAD7Y147_9FUNG|nr:uncharacterized protein O0I10_006109 [Lichtheimia ornata]KAJ8658102.1 hypothetical protein O0I10_006109 [Lichtheimia ornata]